MSDFFDFIGIFSKKESKSFPTYFLLNNYYISNDDNKTWSIFR